MPLCATAFGLPTLLGRSVQQFELSVAALASCGENGSPDSNVQIPENCQPPTISLEIPPLFRNCFPSPRGSSQTWLATNTSFRLASSGARSRLVKNGSKALCV